MGKFSRGGVIHERNVYLETLNSLAGFFILCSNSKWLAYYSTNNSMNSSLSVQNRFPRKSACEASVAPITFSMAVSHVCLFSLTKGMQHVPTRRVYAPVAALSRIIIRQYRPNSLPYAARNPPFARRGSGKRGIARNVRLRCTILDKSQ